MWSCNVLKSKNVDLKNTHDKFTKRRYNLNILLGNQTTPYNKVGLGYESKNNVKKIGNICHSNKTSTYKYIECNYYKKHVHVALVCFI